LSVSPSASPSVGYADYTRGEYTALPADDTDLTTVYSAGDIADVAVEDVAWVTQTATLKYAIHQYKNFAEGTNKCFIEWIGQSSNLTNPVVLQIYNRISPGWETIDQMPITYNSIYDTYSSEHAYYGSPGVDVDFRLSASIPDLTNYKDGQGVIACRIYQLET